MTGIISSVGRLSLQGVDAYLQFSRLVCDAVYWSLVAPLRGRGFRWKSMVHQGVLNGVNAFPIVMFISGLIGFIMALQGAYQVKQFGLESQVPILVGVAMTRELGPLMTAIVLSGRSGSAFAAEIGTMVVQEEIDALRTMGLNPIKFLVVPKFVSMGIMVPTLSIMASVAGMIGGWVVCRFSLGLTTTFVFNQTLNFLVGQDVTTGVIKAVIFGLIIAAVGCYYGFNVRGGAEGVGRSTTATVVSSIFLVIMADGVFTFVFYLSGT